MSEIFIFASGIEDDKEFIIIIFCDNTVILDTSLFIHQQRQCGFALTQGLDVCYCHPFKEGWDVFACHADLTHVRDIKDTTMLTAVEMLLNDSLWILNRHIVTSKWHHFSFKDIFMI
jgi:hypothetical protein